MSKARPLLTDLLPGDVLLYEPTDLFGRIIAIKTWCSDAVHTETYTGNGVSVASRNGLGVNTYAVRMKDLSYVLRPVGDFDLTAAMAWHHTVVGQKYDWSGLLVFYLAAKHGKKDRMWCSEHSTRFARQGGLMPFPETYDADRVAPADFLKSDSYDMFWRHK